MADYEAPRRTLSREQTARSEKSIRKPKGSQTLGLNTVRSGPTDYNTIGRQNPAEARVDNSIPVRYVEICRDLLIVVAVLVLIPWALRLYNRIGDTNGISEDGLSALETPNSILMFQICTQLSEV